MILEGQKKKKKYAGAGLSHSELVSEEYVNCELGRIPFS